MEFFCLLDEPDRKEAARRAVTADFLVKAYQAGCGGCQPAAEVQRSVEARTRHWRLARRGAAYEEVLQSLDEVC